MNDALIAVMALAWASFAFGVSLAYFAKAIKQRKGGNRGNR